MLYLFLLAFLLAQLLVIVGVILFAILFSRPEVPLKGDGGLQRTAVEAGDEHALRSLDADAASRGKDASRDSRKPVNQLMAERPPVFATLPFPSVEGPYQSPVQRPWWLANN